MKSTHRTQAGHDKNLYSCETQPSWESVSSICLFICLFDSPRRSARGTGGPTKVRCQRGVYKIEQNEGEREREAGENRSERVEERETQGRKCGWLGRWIWQCRMYFLRITSGKTTIWLFAMALPIQRVVSVVKKKKRSACVEGKPNHFSNV